VQVPLLLPDNFRTICIHIINGFEGLQLLLGKKPGPQEGTFAVLTSVTFGYFILLYFTFFREKPCSVSGIIIENRHILRDRNWPSCAGPGSENVRNCIAKIVLINFIPLTSNPQQH
jgi:hypothetical protein